MISDGIVRLRRCNFGEMVWIRRNPICPLPVPLFLERDAGVHSADGKNLWKHAGRHVVPIRGAPDGHPDTLDFLFFRRCRCAVPFQQ